MIDEADMGSFAGFKEIIACLRSPDGCPWDKKQTHSSLKPYLIEETYELLQALEHGNSQKICEESGDLLLQIMLHAQIAAENEEYDIEDVIRSISTKLVNRHPHVFGSQKIRDVAEIEFAWEALKQEERGEGETLLAGVPVQMPALIYSQSIQRRVASVGFDWEREEDIITKLAEEVKEFNQARSEEERGREFGDLLFTLVNIGRRMQIDSEMALREANQRFYSRFTYMEKVCHQRDIDFSSLSLNEKNELWEEAKRNEG